MLAQRGRWRKKANILSTLVCEQPLKYLTYAQERKPTFHKNGQFKFPFCVPAKKYYNCSSNFRNLYVNYVCTAVSQKGNGNSSKLHDCMFFANLLLIYDRKYLLFIEIGVKRSRRNQREK